jgi:mannose-6-phosphate isomerase-like protein (cupin superfamily)
MNLRVMIGVGVVLAASIALLGGSMTVLATEPGKPHAKVIPLDNAGQREQQLLGGPPETVTMRSGLIVLQPGQSVGKHGTGQHEEELVVLEGQGRMIFHDGTHLDLAANHVLYCPPETEHDVRNTGTGVLRYVFIVASVK